MKIDSFDGQREGEDITGIWRRHPFILARAGFICAGLIILGSLPEAIWAPSWGVGAIILFLFIGFLYGLSQWFLWFNTIYFLTNERIFAISQKGLLFRVTNEVPIKNIQNVMHSKKGPWQMMMDFGDVEIETSGTRTAMVLKAVEHPYLVQQKILEKS